MSCLIAKPQRRAGYVLTTRLEDMEIISWSPSRHDTATPTLRHDPGGFAWRSAPRALPRKLRSLGRGERTTRLLQGAALTFS